MYSTDNEPLGAVEQKSVIKGAVARSEGRHELVSTDFTAPSPGQSGQAIFAVAVADGFDPSKRGGTLLVAISTETIDKLLHDPTGFGPHGEAILAGSDGQLRSTSRFGNNQADMIADSFLKEGLASGTYRGENVLAASQRLKWGGHDWTVIALESIVEVFAPAMTMIWQIAAITAITALAALVVAMVASQSISRPIAHLVIGMKRLASRDASAVVGGTSRADEVGDMSRAVLVFRDNAIARVAAEEHAKRSQAAVESDRRMAESARAERLRVQADVVSQIGRSLSALVEGNCLAQ
nr:HAMP domain-containing protein [Rhizobium mongolense]